MVGRYDEDPRTSLEPLIDEIGELAQQPVGAVRDVLDFQAFRAVGMADVIVGGDVDSEHVGKFVHSQLLVRNDQPGRFERDLTPEWRLEQIVIEIPRTDGVHLVRKIDRAFGGMLTETVFLGRMPIAAAFVEQVPRLSRITVQRVGVVPASQVGRQLVAIEVGREPLAAAVEKEGPIGRVTGQKNRRPILRSDAKDFRPAVGHDFEAIPQRVNQQIPRRDGRVSFARSDNLGLRIGDAIDILSRRPIEPVVIDDAARLGVGAGQLDRMSRPGRRDSMPMVAVGEPGSVVAAAVDDAVRIESGPKPLEILVRELIDADDDDQARRLGIAARLAAEMKWSEATTAHALNNKLRYRMESSTVRNERIRNNASPRLDRGHRKGKKAF